MRQRSARPAIRSGRGLRWLALAAVVGAAAVVSAQTAGAAGVPNAPVAVFATAGDATALVSWSSGGDGGSPITDYAVTSNPGGLTCSAVAPTTSCNVSGLTDGTPYTFSVIATNAIGPSTPSSDSPAVTPEPAGGPPATPSITGLAVGVVDVLAQLAPGAGSPASSFTVTADPGGAQCTVASDAMPLVCDVTGLTPATAYTFTAVASSIGGTSGPSAPAGPVTTQSAPPAPPVPPAPPAPPVPDVATPTTPPAVAPSTAPATVVPQPATSTKTAKSAKASHSPAPSPSSSASPASASAPASAAITSSTVPQAVTSEPSTDPTPSPAVATTPAAPPTSPIPSDPPTRSPAVVAATSSSAAPAPPSAVLSFGLTIGQKAASKTVSLKGSGFAAHHAVVITMHSTPVVLAQPMVGADGTVDVSFRLPESVPAGAHRLVVDGVGADGVHLTRTWYFQVDTSGSVRQLSAKALAAAPAWAAAAVNPPVQVGGAVFAPYRVTDHPKAAVETEVSALTLLAVVGLGGLVPTPWHGSAEGSAGEDRSRRKGGAGLASAKVKHVKFAYDAEHLGDRSRTWAAPGRKTLDAVSLSLPQRLNRFSPLAARVVSDAAYLRAMFGSLAVLVPVAGIAFGVLAAVQTGGRPLPPETWLVFAIVLLGILDVASGFLAAVAFSCCVIVTGTLTSAAAVRSLLGIDVVFFTVALAASAARPLRRAPEQDPRYWFDRSADAVVAALIGMWALTKTVGALPALSGLSLPIAAHANQLALAAGFTILGRYVAETVGAHLYPARLAAVAVGKLGFPSQRQQLCSLVIQTAVLVFFAQAYLGNDWELWAGAGLFVVPGVVGTIQEKLPNLPPLVRWLPKGVVKIVIMFFVAKWASMLLTHSVSSPAQTVQLGFVLLGLPGLALTFLGFVGRDGDTWKASWFTRIGGIAVVALGVALIEGVITVT